MTVRTSYPPMPLPADIPETVACPNCGKPVARTTVVCPHCGTPLVG